MTIKNIESRRLAPETSHVGLSDSAKINPGELDSLKARKLGLTGTDSGLSKFLETKLRQRGSSENNLKITEHEKAENKSSLGKLEEIYAKAGVDANDPKSEVLEGEHFTTFQQKDIDPHLKGPGIDQTNLERMTDGLSPYMIVDGKLKKVELHHHEQNSNGPLVELDSQTHRAEATTFLHPHRGLGEGRGDNQMWQRQKEAYWKNRAKSFEEV